MNSENKLNMFDLPDANKKLILHTAFIAVCLDDWHQEVFSSNIPDKIKKDLVGKLPSCDPMNNLLNLASRLFSDFNEELPIINHLHRIKAFVYGQASGLERN